MTERLCTCGAPLTKTQTRFCSKPCRLEAMRNGLTKTTKSDELGAYEPAAVLPPVGMVPIPGEVDHLACAHVVQEEMAKDVAAGVFNAKATAERVIARSREFCNDDWRRPKEAQDAMDSWHRKLQR